MRAQSPAAPPAPELDRGGFRSDWPGARSGPGLLCSISALFSFLGSSCWSRRWRCGRAGAVRRLHARRKGALAA